MAEKSDRAKKEEKILQFWKENKIFEKSLEKKSPKGEFVFYEGPPTANGRPAIHHVEARAFKDAIPRYKTMRGYHVRRKAGWDTHGLPVELEVEKTLGLKSKKEIEAYGIAKFNEECKKSVWKYVDEWKNFTDRIGFWVDMDHPYVTYYNDYVEAVWSILAHVEDKKLLYKDYKVVPWCPRCGTALSSHELAQGYQDVKDISLYVKFKVKGQDNTYLIAWTTTPWTLPGNVALAVGNDIQYVKRKRENEYFIVAKDRADKWPGHESEEILGKDLVGLEYEPLYPFTKSTNNKAYKVYAADFVNTEDGTGIVHTAVMYGQDDFVLGTQVGLPKEHTVDETGHFKDNTDFLSGKSVIDESTSVEILKDLQARDLLFEKESYTHSYPFCWRCKTRLIYYARDSWYIRMSELRDELVSENNKIHWEPEHIKEGRFGEWLREVKDWAISRERYWGTPLPIWQTVDGKKRIVVDSTETLKKYAKKSNNKYFVMRHGQSTHNLSWGISTKAENKDVLTEKGKKQALESALKLKGKGIDLLVISPFLRTKETAKIVQDTLGLSQDDIILEDDLHEFGVYSFEGKTWKEYHEAFPKTKEYFDKKKEGDESYKDVKHRVMKVLYDCENKYKDKTILFITHGGPAWILSAGSEFLSLEKTYDMIDRSSPHLTDMKNAEVRELKFVPMPHNEQFERELHRPYIDEIILEKDGEEYRRVKEVMDVWFDSGAVPFAQDPKNVIYPADFISEAIDQTRGWFYTLHAVGVLMGKGHAYKNVVSLGHLLDKDGKKMSKSIGNVVNPWDMADKYGVDALRLWMYSVNQPGESKNFNEQTVDEINKKLFNILDNVYAFYDLYRDKELEKEIGRSNNILDKWILSRLNKTIEMVTTELDNYKFKNPVELIELLANDLSTWYLRRSRDRIKDGDKNAKQTIYFALKEISKLLAPFAPFAAEDIYQKLRSDSDPESVHMEDWPELNSGLFSMFSKPYDNELLKEMASVRSLVSDALALRTKAGIKVRQPLSKLKVKDLKLTAEYIELIKDEVNVKEVVEDKNIETATELITELTPELIEEGKVRDAIRTVQEWRKEKGLKPGEEADYKLVENNEFYLKHKLEIENSTNVKLIEN